jgi:outer membrane protein TolC
MSHRNFLFGLLALGFSLIFNKPVMSQDSTLNLTLEQARGYALQHNKEVKNAKRNIEAADLTVKQTISSYLPHLSLSASVTDYLDLATSILPGEMFGSTEDVAVQFGQQYNSDWGGTATQMIFNGSLIVGIQSAKLAGKLANQSLVVQERDVLKNLESSYFLALTCEESIDILKENLKNIDKLYEQTKVSNKAGLIEDTQVDQLMVQKTSVKDALLSMERQLEVSNNLIRFQLGIDANAPLSLTDSLTGLIEDFQIQQLVNNIFDLNNNVDYRLMNTQVEISEAMVKNEKATWLPTVSAYYTYSRTGMGNEMNSLQWFPMSIVGVQASFPVFGSGERIHAINKAKVNY